MNLQGTMRINAQGHLEIGGCDVVDLAKEFGTPLYIMDEAEIRGRCRAYLRAFRNDYPQAEILYAGKTFLTLAMCRIIAQEGLGLDVVSGGELYTALKADFPREKIYFHGNNKTPAEIAMALDGKVGRFVVDNFDEIQLVNAMAGERGTKASVLLRVTPGIEAHTHSYIQTGQLDSKFGFTLSTGMALTAAKAIEQAPHLELVGIHCHIGSQIFDLEPYGIVAGVMMDFAKQIKAETGIEVREIDLGGGLGIKYTREDEPAEINDYARVVLEKIKTKAGATGMDLPKVLVEPGRSIAGPAGTTIYTVGTIKEIPQVRKYVAVDGGMADNIRPALYESKYEAIVANKANAAATETVTITGKCCESGDMLISDALLPPLQRGDILAVTCTGAYNYSMSSNYNRLPRPAVVLVNDGQAELIVKREDFADLVRNDLVPERLRK